MREKIGIKQIVTAAEFEQLKEIDPLGVQDIQVRQSPHEILFDAKLRSLRIMLSIFWFVAVCATSADAYFAPSFFDYLKGFNDLVSFVAVVRAYMSKDKLKKRMV